MCLNLYDPTVFDGVDVQEASGIGVTSDEETRAHNEDLIGNSLRVSAHACPEHPEDVVTVLAIPRAGFMPAAPGHVLCVQIGEPIEVLRCLGVERC